MGSIVLFFKASTRLLKWQKKKKTKQMKFVEIFSCILFINHGLVFLVELDKLDHHHHHHHQRQQHQLVSACTHTHPLTIPVPYLLSLPPSQAPPAQNPATCKDRLALASSAFPTYVNRRRTVQY